MQVDTSTWVVCDCCSHPYDPTTEGCDNPRCLANPRLSVAVRESIAARSAAYRAEQEALAERQRLYALSFQRR